MKILHIGETLIDAPFPHLPTIDSSLRRKDNREVFLRAINYVLQEKIDLLLISGNLVDNHFFTLDTIDFLTRAFCRIPDCKVIISPGYADSFDPFSLYDLQTFPNNVHVFQKTDLDSITFEDLDVTVYGWAYASKEYNHTPLDGAICDSMSTFKVVCGYGNKRQQERVSYVSVNEIGSFGGDYVALSGDDLFSGFQTVNQTKYAYSGSLEHYNYDQSGIGGGNYIELYLDENHQKRINTKRVFFGMKRYVCELFDLSSVNTTNDLIARINAVIKEKQYNKDTALRVVLSGEVPVDFVIPKTLTPDTLGLYAFEIVDETYPKFNSSKVARDMTIRGEFERSLLPSMREGTSEEKLSSAYAIRIGLSSLSGKDVSKM